MQARRRQHAHAADEVGRVGALNRDLRQQLRLLTQIQQRMSNLQLAHYVTPKTLRHNLPKECQPME